MSRDLGLLLLWAALGLALLTAALPNTGRLGLYYDEAFLAQQARDFTEPTRAGVHPASVRSVRLFGRSYPLRNAAYLGSLKSQLLIPSLALFGSSVHVLRTTTLVFGLVALLFCMLFARECFGTRAAAVSGLLIASDPSFYFFSQFEWGPFVAGLLCRSGGGLLLVLAWRRRKAWLFFASGLLLGLGVYSRVDFIVILAAAGTALLVCRPALLRETLTERRASALAAMAGFALSAGSMLISARQIFTTSSGIAERGGLGYKAQVLWSVLDGSHFLRLMQVGGLFDEIFESAAASGIFAWALIPSALLLLGLLAKAERRHARSDPRTWLLLTTLLLSAGMLATPGAVRAHHMLNLMPFVQLVVACALAAPWKANASQSARLRTSLRALSLVGLALIVGANLYVTSITRAEIDATGGRGRWSLALQEFAVEVDDSRERVLVSLDWGFHEPLLFTTQRAQMIEPIWAIPAALAQGRPWSHEGDEHTIYLVHPERYDLFGLSQPFLVAARAHRRAGAVIREHRDAADETAFLSVRIPQRHQLRYAKGFTIDLLSGQR